MERYCLKSSDFQANIKESFRQLREQNEFIDVTLACDDYQQFDAHKVILSAGSQFFRNLLQRIKHLHPFIYLKGIEKAVLENILDFLYNGEVRINKEDLETFMKVARELQIRGLESSHSEVEKCPDIITKSTRGVEEVKVNTDHVKHETFIESLEEVTQDFITPDAAPVDDLAEVITKDLDNKIDGMIGGMSEKLNGVWKCKVCGKSFDKKGNLKHHIESSHIEGVSHTCHYCNKTSRTRHSLAVHIQDYHYSQISFSCDVCSKNGMSKSQYKHHKRTCGLSRVGL